MPRHSCCVHVASNRYSRHNTGAHPPKPGLLMPAEFFFDDRSTMFAALQAALCARLQESLAVAEHCTLLLSGGNTPVPLYQQLASADLPWQRIEVALCDERWVDTAHEASNERMLRTTLLRERAALCRFTGMKSTLPLGPALRDAAAAVHDCNTRYARLPKPWSAALLGMGPDGHTASLFPAAEGLQAALSGNGPCAAIHARASAVTGIHLQRMTLTPRALLDCGCIYLLFTGTDRRAVYERALTAPDRTQMPVSLFLQQDTVPVHVYWCP